MRVLADKLNVVWSSKVMPSAASGPVISASCSKIGSLMRSAATFPGLPRVTVALPCSVATWPTSPVASSAAGAAGFCAGAGGFCARAAKGQSIAPGDVQTAANFLMKSRRFKLASEGIAAGKRRENKGKNPRKERAGRRPEESGYLLIVAAPALQTTSSCEPVAPEQPIAPMSLPSSISGIPPREATMSSRVAM